MEAVHFAGGAALFALAEACEQTCELLLSWSLLKMLLAFSNMFIACPYHILTCADKRCVDNKCRRHLPVSPASVYVGAYVCVLKV